EDATLDRTPLALAIAGFTLADLVALFATASTRRREEEALRQTQADLAHIQRVNSMGELSASIAHEVMQPITAASTCAEAALRWLNAQPPNLEEARQALDVTVKAGNRTIAVIERIRALVKKAPPQKHTLEINGAILEVIALTRDQILKNGVSVQTQ